MFQSHSQKKILLILVLALITPTSCAVNHTIDKMAHDIYSRSNFDDPLPPNAFVSDGCSCWPDSGWVECCIKHDVVYWMGGTRGQRKQADLELKRCVSEKGHPVIAQMMYFGVRIGGVWWLPTPFRWGFGWEYPQSGPPDKHY